MRLVNEFHLSFQELDNLDEPRALRLMAARNIENALRLVTSSVANHRVDNIPADVWKLYLLATSANDEVLQ